MNIGISAKGRALRLKLVKEKLSMPASMRRVFWKAAAFALALLGTTSVALAAPVLQEEGAGGSAEVWAVLLPLLTAAVGVERGIEIFWNYVDWLLLNLRTWQPAQLKSAQYVQFKSGTSLLLGVVLGVLIANYTDMRLLGYLRPLAPRFLENVPVVWDVVITGIIIGAGAKPAHDILGIITQLKNLLGNGAIRQRELAGAALAEGVLKLAQSDAQAMIDVPGVGPARIAPPGTSFRGENGEEDEAAQPTATERYIEVLRNRTTF